MVLILKTKPELSTIHKSPNRWINSLNDGLKWKLDSGSPKTSIFYRLNKRPGVEIRQIWSNEEKNRVKNALNSISAVTALKFKPYKKKESFFEPHIDLYLETHLITRNAFGNSISPRKSKKDGTIKINIDYYKNLNGEIIKPINSGSFLGITFLHELCHSLGLKHPHDKGLNGEPKFPGIGINANPYMEKGKYNQNAFPFTQMSYTFEMMNGVERTISNASAINHGYLLTPGSLDIATLQWMYGINDRTNRTDTIYQLPTKNKPGTGWTCIWDTGGMDTITGKNSNKNVTIDLRPATLAMKKNAGGYLSKVDQINGGFLIAKPWNGKNFNHIVKNYLIENAIGGSGNDTITGNSASNYLSGGDGNDKLYGRVDGDTLTGGKGEDSFVVSTISNTQDIKKTTISDFNEAENDTIKIMHNNIIIKKIKSISRNLDGNNSDFKNHSIQILQDNSIQPGTTRSEISIYTNENILSKTLTTTIKILNEEI